MSHRSEAMSVMMKCGRVLVVTVILLASLQATVAAASPVTPPRADAGVQTLIERAVAAIVRNDEETVARVEALRETGNGDRRGLLLQLALYLQNSTGTEQSMGGALIVHQLAFTPDEKLAAILPHMDAAAPALRRVFTELLSTIDRPEGGDPDFSYYESWILKDKDAPQWALVRYLYEVSPDAALASMERIHAGGPAGHDGTATKQLELRRLLTLRETGASWSTRDKERVRATLDALCRDPGWWRRLYAATLLASNPDLATPDMTARLKADPHPLVSTALSR